MREVLCCFHGHEVLLADMEEDGYVSCSLCHERYHISELLVLKKV